MSLAFDACGTGGRMRRGDSLGRQRLAACAAYNFLNVEGAYDWTWNRKGVCAYCAHCAVVNQVLPIEGLGRPMRMTQYPDNPNDPCRWIIYKKPDSFPTRHSRQLASRGRRRDDSPACSRTLWATAARRSLLLEDHGGHCARRGAAGRAPYVGARFARAIHDNDARHAPHRRWHRRQREHHHLYRF